MKIRHSQLVIYRKLIILKISNWNQNNENNEHEGLYIKHFLYKITVLGSLRND